MPALGSKKQKKATIIEKLEGFFARYKQIVIVSLLNVSSTQVQQTRVLLRKTKGELVIGKNTVIKKAILNVVERDADLKGLEKLLPLLKDKFGLIFTDQPVYELKPEIERNRRQGAAKVGMTAPIDVIVPPGPTGMDPSQIHFFHALQIPTKIQKTQIEIVKDVHLCKKGRKITNSEAVLLQRLNLKPFQYGMEVLTVYDDGSILSNELVSLSPDDVLKKFQTGCSYITALSLELGIPTEASVVQNVFNGFKNLAAISVVSGYKFRQFSDQAGPAQAAPAKEAAPAKAAAAPVKEEKPAEEELEGGFGGLFD
eukprot:TRINITY_DN12661_c0_g1_i1.p1 TRINITY_DN12661_c0_g1~~TRINITY_DN12661_c0_g1_i1.p1  ORF type:complete len:312 (+),score=135.21 TRINITY_DN12661_c0_g1_i1:11-946(+)